jgi:hypothetical protein
MVLIKQNVEGMQIRIGELYVNKTLKYLVPALLYYGDTFKAKLNTVQKLAFGLFDMNLVGSHLEGQKNIYMLIDMAVRADLFFNFLDWVRHQDYYVTDYVADSVLGNESRRHMVVIAFPLIMEDVYDKFLEGKYSKMYTKKEIESYFSDNSKVTTKAVLTKSLAGKQFFVNLIKETYDTTITDYDIRQENPEFDIPPINQEEIFM